MVATDAPGPQPPMAVSVTNWSQATRPKFDDSLLDELLWISVTALTPGVVRRSVSTWPGTNGTLVAAGHDEVEKLQNRSAKVSLPALPPSRLLEAAIELSAPIAALVTKRAS